MRSGLYSVRWARYLPLFPDPKIPIQTCLIISINKHWFAAVPSTTETVTSSAGKSILYSIFDIDLGHMVAHWVKLSV